MSSASATGRRDETSVMFSLSALMAKGASTSGPETSDESGLIDLKAIAAAAGKPTEAALMTADIAPFPFEIAPAPPPAPAVEAARAEEPAVMAPARRSRALFAGAAVAVVAIAAAALGAFASGSEPLRAAELDLGYTAKHAAEAVALIPPPKAAEPSPSVAAAEPGAPSATTAQRIPTSMKPATQSRPGSPSGTTNDKPASNTNSGQTATKPPSGPCDLMCQMQRAAGR